MKTKMKRIAALMMVLILISGIVLGALHPSESHAEDAEASETPVNATFWAVLFANLLNKMKK